jgi:hypothetical protein
VTISEAYIAINSLVFKVFERCIPDKLGSFLLTNDNQFGFEEGLGCSHAIYTAKSVVDRFISNGYTANLCSIDLSKAFDYKVSIHALLIKLMKKHTPVIFIELLEFWLCYS